MTDAPLTERPPMQPGDRYTIRNHSMAGEPIIEGDVTLVHPDPFGGDDRWFVRFDSDEPGELPVSRHVLPEDRVSP